MVAEQKLVEEHDRIVLQFPLYWYSSPRAAQGVGARSSPTGLVKRRRRRVRPCGVFSVPNVGRRERLWNENDTIGMETTGESDES